MKRRSNIILSLLLALIIGLSPLGTLRAAALSANEITNPSMETASSSDSTLPDGWLKGGWGTNSPVYTYDTTGHTGSRSVKIQMTNYTDGDAKWYFTPQAVTAGTKYDFSDYYKSTVATNLVAQFDDGNGNYTYADLATVAAAADWTQTTTTFTAPTGAKNITIFHLINAVGTLSIDDASLSASAVVSTPTVNITSPTANSTVSGNVNLTASASDANGIAGVQFKVDSTNVGSEVTSSPYQTTLDTTSLTNGTHSITAVARNLQGGTATSNPVSITVSNTTTPPPTSSNLVPNASVETPDPANSNKPQNWQSGGWGTNTTNYSYLATSGQDGSHSVKVQTTQYTNGDAKWYFDPIAVTAGTKYDFSDYYMSSIASDVVVQFDNGNGTYSYLDLGTATASASWKQYTASFTVPTGMKNATVFHLISGVGTLQTDNYSLAPSSTPTPTGPTVAVSAPTANSTVSGTSVALSATASDTTGIKNVQFKVDGVNVGNADTTSPYGITWDSTTVTNGNHTVTAVATNTGGVSTTSTSVNVTVNNGSSANMIANPSMETADPAKLTSPLHWNSDKWGTNTTTFTYLGSGAHSGSKAVQVKMSNRTDGDAKWYFDPVTVTPGTQYRFSDYYKATVGTEVDVAFTMSDGSVKYQIIGLPETSSTVWANFSTTFTVPQGAVNMTVFHLIRSNGVLSLDDESLTPYTPTGFNRALVSLTFDDGYASSYTNGLPLLQKYNLPSTQFIVSGLVDTQDYMTKAQVQAFSAAGHEIGSHSVTHPDMTSLTKTRYDRELTNSQTSLQQWIGKPVTDFAFPEGLYNQAIITDAKPLYQSTRGVEAGLNSKDNFNAYDIKVEDVDSTTTTAQVADWIAQAQATKTWLVLVYHSIDPTNTGDYNVTPTNLDSQLAAIKSSGITALTLQQALAEVKGQL